jgi:type IV pilus biogenesis protein PilP
MKRLPRGGYLPAAFVVLAISAGVAVAAAIGAIHIETVEAAPSERVGSLVRSIETAPVPGVDIDAVGGNDIFQPDRTALPSRYRMPGESVTHEQSAPAEPAKPVVLGTVISTDKANFATCQLPGGQPTIVHVGERLGEYTVEAIERDRVVFRTAKGTLLEILAARQGIEE